MEQQHADALALVAEAALHHGMNPAHRASGTRSSSTNVDAGVLVDAEAPGQSVPEGGARVPAGTSQRMACDASRVVMRHDPEGRITEVGARTSTIPPALRRALHRRDKGCRFPGCGRPFGEGIISSIVKRGLQIDARTSTPGWQRERLDVGYAISVLHPRAISNP